MQLNDYKINRKLKKYTNNINFIGKNKYLSRESSANKFEQSIYKSLSSSQLLTKSHRDNNHLTNKIQQISTIGSIYSKDSAYFNSISNEQLNIPPIRSLNKDDGDKLIATLNKQIKQQNLLISKLKQQIITQTTDIENISIINEQFQEKQQSYEEITQNYHSSNQKIQQLAQIRDIQPYTNDNLEIVTQLYTDDYKLQVASKWRNQKLKLNFIRGWLKATQFIQLLNNFTKKLNKNKLQQYYNEWKRFLILKSDCFQFNEVKELRIKIFYWKQWKCHILQLHFKQQNYTKIFINKLFNNFNELTYLAKLFYFYSKRIHWIIKNKVFYKIQNTKNSFIQQFHNNINKKEVQQKLELSNLVLFLIIIIQIFSKAEIAQFSRIQNNQLDNNQINQDNFNNWKHQILNRKLIQGKQNEYLKQKKQLITRKKVFRFLQINLKYYQQKNQIIIQDRIQGKLKKLFIQIKEYCNGIAFKQDQIKLNRPYYIKYHFWKRWSYQYNMQVQLMVIGEKIKEKRQFKQIYKIFNVLKRNANYKKFQKQNAHLITLQYNKRIINQSLRIWLSNLLKQKILLDKEQSCCISQLKVIDQQQSDDVIELSHIYQNKLQQVKIYEEEINNYQLIQANQNKIKNELQVQQYIFILYFVIICNKS